MDLTSLSGHSHVSFSFSWCSIRGPGAQLSASFLYRILSPTGLVPKSIGGPEGPFCCVVAFLTTSCLQLIWSPTRWPSYIIVQSPTQSLEWRVWSSSSGKNCHAVQRSLSAGESVYKYIMSFYLVLFRQPNPPTRFLSITSHWNVSLPSSASLWNGIFGRVEGQNTTLYLLLLQRIINFCFDIFMALFCAAEI